MRLFYKKYDYSAAVIAITALFLFLVPPGAYAENIQNIKNKVSKSIETEIETQKATDKWKNEKHILKNKYEYLSAKNDKLKSALFRLQNIHKNETAKKDEFLRKQNEVSRVKSELNSYLNNILDDLEILIEKDLPFHREERLLRIKTLKNELYLADMDPAEKFRRVFEALQIETEFGKTVEVYNSSINFDNDEKLVNILRVGRVSLFYLSTDEKAAGKYNPYTKKWEEVSSGLKKEIQKGILTAKGERTAELVKLPFGRIVK